MSNKVLPRKENNDKILLRESMKWKNIKPKIQLYPLVFLFHSFKAALSNSQTGSTASATVHCHFQSLNTSEQT